MKTVQMNVRINRELLKEIEAIADYYKLDKTDWLRTHIAELVVEEKKKITASKL